MQFDDRLATVLRMRAGSDAVSRTQFRQLLDLLGSRSDAASNGLKSEAYTRLGELMAQLPQEDQSRILREPGLRLRNPELVTFLAGGDAKPAAAAVATAQLSEAQWLALIPDLPVTARGFLRHRRDLPPRVRRQLEELGVLDFALPEPGGAAARQAIQDVPFSQRKPVTPTEGIGALLRRIEAFRQERATQAGSPRLPLDDEKPEQPISGIEFVTDVTGTVTWASEAVAPFVVGMRLTARVASSLVERGSRVVSQLAAHQPLLSERFVLDAAPVISGEWFCDAAPLFEQHSGAFIGYRGCLRRDLADSQDEQQAEAAQSDAMRQVLHELRTPVNAIQGFAEIIQQQLFGTAPHEYRAHAAAISVDAAKLLAGFDEVDRLVKLESGALALEKGTSDFHEAVADTVQRLHGVLRPRNAGFELKTKGESFVVGLERSEALTLAWRLLATAAGAMGPGETIRIKLASDGARIRLRMKVPASLLESARAMQGEQRRRVVSAGMFGPEFTFRLAQAEAGAAGGKLKCKKDRVTLTIPALTANDSELSAAKGRAGEDLG